MSNPYKNVVSDDPYKVQMAGRTVVTAPNFQRALRRLTSVANNVSRQFPLTIVKGGVTILTATGVGETGHLEYRVNEDWSGVIGFKEWVASNKKVLHQHDSFWCFGENCADVRTDGRLRQAINVVHALQRESELSLKRLELQHERRRRDFERAHAISGRNTPAAEVVSSSLAQSVETVLLHPTGLGRLGCWLGKGYCDSRAAFIVLRCALMILSFFVFFALLNGWWV